VIQVGRTANTGPMANMWRERGAGPSKGENKEHRMSAAIQFGEFQADLHARELRRLGTPVPLQAQPFEVLLALLQRPGQLTSRESLQKQIWPDISFIDAQGGLNKAVNRLREALGDRSGKPQFIETFPNEAIAGSRPCIMTFDRLLFFRSQTIPPIQRELNGPTASPMSLLTRSPVSPRWT